jgi:5-formyltetrahydrofolate cyclo-ligase
MTVADAAVHNQKSALRAEILARRDALPTAERKAAADMVAVRSFPIPVPAGAIVSGFFPMKSEINPLPLMRKLADAGAQLALPVIAGRGKPLTMRAWHFGAPLETGQWGIREPTADAAEVAPDVVIVPIACFDRSGHRIGYGAGYYDMTIHALRVRKPVIAVGIAFAVQEIPQVPATDRDERLDLVLTEREVIDLRRT